MTTNRRPGVSRADLEAYRDGELPFWARRRVARHLRRDPELRRTLASLESLGALLREVDAEAPTPDLWAGIRLRLVEEDVRREGAKAPSAWRRPVGFAAIGAIATAAIALALFPGPEAAPPAGVRPAPAGSVRWIDGRGNPMMVLRDDREATIIWVPERES